MHRSVCAEWSASLLPSWLDSWSLVLHHVHMALCQRYAGYYVLKCCSPRNLEYEYIAFGVCTGHQALAY